MSEGETQDPVPQPPPLPGLTADVGLIPPSPDEPLDRSDLAVFIGPNAERFISVLGLAGARRRGRWTCWPGFFFPIAWFMYRKMYGWAALACALPIFASVMNFGLLKPALIGLPTVVGLAGRRVYVGGALRTIARIRASQSGRSEDALRQTLARAGGVSVAGAIVGGAIVLCAFAVQLRPLADSFASGFAAGFQAHFHR